MRSRRHDRPIAYKGRWLNPIGTIEDCLENMPHSLSLSTRSRGWQDLTLDVHPGSGPFELRLPPLDHVVIMMTQPDTARSEGIIDGRSYENVTLPFGISIYPPFMRHTCWGESTPRASTVSITADFLDNAARTLSNGTVSTLAFEPKFATRDPALIHFHEILLAELQTPPHPTQTILVSAVANAIAIHLARNHARIDSSARPTAGIKLSVGTLALIREYLQAHLTGCVQLDDLAAIAGVSRFHFIRAFKATTSLTPMQYVERTRIGFACRILEAGDMSLAEVAHLVGYADQSHFTRRFRLHVGCTPGAYARARAPRSPGTLQRS